MISANIKDTLGNSYKINLIENLSELPLSKKVAFDECREEALLSIENLTLNNKELTYFLYHIARAVSEIVDVDLTDVLNFSSGITLDDSGELNKDDLIYHMENSDVDLESLEMTLMHIYNYLSNIIDNYTPEIVDNFMYKNESIRVPKKLATLVSGIDIFEPISTRTAIEILQIRKALSDNVKPSANIRYTSVIKTIALLTRRVDEVTPLDDAEFNRHIDNKMRFFADINTKDAMDVSFFLIRTILI